MAETASVAPSRKRDQTITLRVTPEEKTRVRECAEKCGLSLTDYVLWTSIYGDQTVMVLDSSSLEACRRELSKQGNNLNQIAHALNIVARRRSTDPDLADFANDNILTISELYASCLDAYKTVASLQSEVHASSLRRDLLGRS